jgi:hypothetical protein
MLYGLVWTDPDVRSIANQVARMAQTGRSLVTVGKNATRLCAKRHRSPWKC